MTIIIIILNKYIHFSILLHYRAETDETYSATYLFNIVECFNRNIVTVF